MALDLTHPYRINSDAVILLQIFLEKGLMERLMKVLDMGEPTLKVSALWAVKNLLRKSSVETKKDVMRSLGWERLTRSVLPCSVTLSPPVSVLFVQMLTQILR
jgi:hypothetical protein